MRFVDAHSIVASTTAPASGAVVDNVAVTLSADASADSGVAGVTFYIDGVKQGSEDTASPYSMTWDSTAVSNGAHAFYSVTRDNAGAYATSSSISFMVDNGALTPSVLSPSGNEATSSTMTLSADTNDHTVTAGVSFFINGTKVDSEITSVPYTTSYDTTATSSDTYTIVAVSRDLLGGYATSSPVTFSISNSRPAVSTQTPSVTQTGAILNGEINNPGSSDPTARGFTWGTSALYGATTTEAGDFIAGPFNTVLASLSCASTYHFRTYAINILGTSYGSDVPFTTSACGVSNGGGGRGSGSISISGSFVQHAASIVATTTLSETGWTTTSSVYLFLRDLGVGAQGDDVKQLQQFLNASGFFVAGSGAGSVGKETTYFGLLTKRALIRYQETYRTEILVPLGLFQATGYFGASTRAFINRQQVAAVSPLRL